MTDADLIIKNAKVFTADKANPTAEAMAVAGTRIALVGRSAEAEAWRGARAGAMHGAGRWLLPASIDSRFHLRRGSLELGGAQLADAAAIDDLTAALRRRASAQPKEARPAVPRVTASRSPAVISTRSFLTTSPAQCTRAVISTTLQGAVEYDSKTIA